MGRKEFFTLSNLQGFVASEDMGQGYSLMKFRASSRYSNVSHIHLQLIQSARMLFLKTILTLRQYLDFHIISSNCDGFITCSTTTLASHLDQDTPGIFVIDAWLKPNLTEKQTKEYLQMKTNIFGTNGSCNEHTKNYIISLMEKRKFQQKTCCATFPFTKTSQSRLKIEHFGSRASILGINKSLTLQQFSNEPIIKCSGSSDIDTAKFIRMSGNSAEQLFEKLNDLNNPH